jgi:hypothetical protein
MRFTGVAGSFFSDHSVHSALVGRSVLSDTAFYIFGVARVGF